MRHEKHHTHTQKKKKKIPTNHAYQSSSCTEYMSVESLHKLGLVRGHSRELLVAIGVQAREGLFLCLLQRSVRAAVVVAYMQNSCVLVD